MYIYIHIYICIYILYIKTLRFLFIVTLSQLICTLATLVLHSHALKLKNFNPRKLRIFFGPNINPSKILSCPKLFPAENFRRKNFSFFLQ